MYDLKNAKFIEAKDNCKIYYWLNKGTNSKKTIIFHAGSSMNHSSMILLERLFNKEGFSTLVFDQRGTGYSSKPLSFKKYDLASFASDLEYIVNKEKIKNPVFVTDSFGFMPCVNYADKTGNADKIISINGSYDFSKTIISPLAYFLFQFVLRHTGWAYGLYNYGKEKILGAEIPYMDFSKARTDKGIIAVFKYQTSSYLAANTAMAYKNLHTTILPQLSRLDVPIFNISGDDDPIVTNKANEVMKENVKHFKNIKVKGSHFLTILDYKSVFNIAKGIIQNTHSN